MLKLPEEFVVQKFFQLTGNPKHNRYNNTYMGSCNLCREGKSWLKKRRLYYIPAHNNIYCHNCGYSGTPIDWIIKSTGSTFEEIKGELKESEFEYISIQEKIEPILPEFPTLPDDCINLFDPLQIDYYKDNNVIKQALKVLKSRRLIKAINRPSTFYISLTDAIHKNRLVIPFVDENNKIVHYQSRSIFDNDVRPRYLSKMNSEKSLFNYNNVSASHENVYIFEGPLNACFVTNGIAVAGIQEKSEKLFTEKQQEQINALWSYNQIWVLDSQWIDSAALKKSCILAEMGLNLFIWPENIGRKFKDFNDLAIAGRKDSINPSFIVENTHSGLRAKLLLSSIKAKVN